MFADDCILFGEVSDGGIQVIREILKEYELCSGQCVNFKKSMIFSSSNVHNQDKNLVVQALHVCCSTGPRKHLGLSNMVGRNKKLAFQTLKDSLKQKINSWSIQHISQGRKEVFIKAVLQAIPTFPMSCFLLPKTLCEEMENIIGGFFVAKKSWKKRIALV